MFVLTLFIHRAPPDINNTAEYRARVDLTDRTQACMKAAFEKRDELEMFQCWSNASTYDDFGKSADMASVCPYHYNHWSCTGLRGGGGNWGRNICRCKVGFDMINHLSFKPVLNKCHLIHLNDNKYRFQLIRTHSKKGKKHAMENFIFEHDNGNITAYNPIAVLYRNEHDGFPSTEYNAFNLSDPYTSRITNLPSN